MVLSGGGNAGKVAASMMYEIYDRITGRSLGTAAAASPAKAKVAYVKAEQFDSVRQLELARSVALSARTYPY